MPGTAVRRGYDNAGIGAPYTATKHAITGLTKSIVLDVGTSTSGTPVPGWARACPSPTGRSAPESTFDVDHVGQAVSYMAGLPLNANVLFMTVMAKDMLYVGRG